MYTKNINLGKIKLYYLFIFFLISFLITPSSAEEEIYFATKEMYDLIIKKKDFNLSQKNFYDNFEKFYKNPLVKKTMISEKFYLENIELFT